MWLLRRVFLIMIVLGPIGIYESFQLHRVNRLFQYHGVTTFAQPDGPVVKGQSYQGPLVFRTEAGDWITIPAGHVPMSIRESFRELKKVEVKYLPEEPSTVRFSDWEKPDPGFFQPILLFVAGVVGFAILARNRR